MKKYMTTDELLSALKSKARCRTNQELLDLLEKLADIMRKKRAISVYKNNTVTRIKSGNDRFKSAAPEADYIRA